MGTVDGRISLKTPTQTLDQKNTFQFSLIPYFSILTIIQLYLHDM